MRIFYSEGVGGAMVKLPWLRNLKLQVFLRLPSQCTVDFITPPLHAENAKIKRTIIISSVSVFADF